MKSRPNQFATAGKISEQGILNGAGSHKKGREIAIIGMSGRFPGGANSPELLWELLRSGVDGVGEAQGDRWDLGWHHPDAGRDDRAYTRAGGFLDRIDAFDAEFFGISPKEARQVDPQHRLLLELAWEAIEDASLAPRRQAGSDMGVFIGISGNDYAYLVGPQAPDAYSNTGSSLSIAANRISYIFDLHGPSVALDTACSSSLVCVHQACNSLLSGECSTALAGGVNLLINVRPWIGFSKASMLSPTGRCKSFDASGDGYVRSEGGGLILLKPLADAERDGDRILGVILASGVNSDGRTLGLSMPNGDAQERLLRKVYSQCAVQAEDVFYVEAHGTGTSVGDPIECGALGRVLGKPRADDSRCLIGSVKSNIGHLEAASGIAGLIKVLLSLRHGEIPGNLHFVDPNPKIDFEDWKLDVVKEATRLPFQERPIVIGVNSFGFGGTNAHLVIQEYRPSSVRSVREIQKTTDFQRILLLSGHSQAALTAVVQSYLDMLRCPQFSWEDICAAAATCRSMQRYRLAIAAGTAEEAVERLECYLAGQPMIGRFASGSAPSPTVPLAFVYSGNGPQWWGMGRELLAKNEIFRDEITAVDNIFAPLAGWSLLQEMQRPESESRVVLTEFAQPLLFALQLGLTRVLRESGAIPSVVIGHSVGEAAAAYASGALSLEQATRVIFYRSKAQSRTAGMGRMAALGVSESEAQEVMRSIPGWLEIAAKNAPESITVAGDRVALEQMIRTMTEKGKFARLLQLNYPFHTKAMESIREELLEELCDLRPGESEIPFVSTVDAAVVAGSTLDANYWYRNVREPVQFSEAIRHLLTEQGIGVFLEIGPHPVLKDYVQQLAKASGSTAVSLQTLRRPGSRGPEPELDHLWTAICACHANGAIDPDRIFTRPVPPPVLPLYPWQKVQHWRGSVILPDVSQPTQRDHPLLGYQLTSGEGIWENTLDTNQIQYLNDHVVQGSVVFPAAGYIEMGLSAAQRILGAGLLDVEDMEITRPLVIPAHGDPLIQFSADTASGTFEIRSRVDQYSNSWLRYVRGSISRSELPHERKFMNLTEISSRLSCPVSSEEHYAGVASRGMNYGPAFQGIVEMTMTAPEGSLREAIAFIDLPDQDSDDLIQYRAHPSLLDSCLQAVVTLIAQNEERNCAIIPVRFGRVRSFAPLPNSIVCHVAIRQESDRSATADFQVTDTRGNLLLTIEEARCQKVDFGQGTASPLISEWWRLDSRAPMPERLPTLLSPLSLHEALRPDSDRIAEANGRADYYKKLRPRIDQLVEAFVGRAIDSLRSGKSKFDVASLARMGRVGPEQLGLLARLIDIAGRLKLVVSEGPLFRWNADAMLAPEPIWESLFQECPRYQAELMLIGQVGDSLPAMLRGEVSPGLLSDGSSNIFDQLYDTAPFQAPYNQLARAAVEMLVQSWPQNRPLRILEIGGANGGLSSWLLPVLPERRTDYLFTDPSEVAIGRAEHRLSAHRFVRFLTVDLESDFIEQGLPANYFDMVIAANVLHTVDDPDSLLAMLKKVMASDAQLLVMEAHANPATGMFFLHCPTLSSRLRDASTWSKRLSDAGFEEIATFSDASVCGDSEETQQSVFLSRRTAPCVEEIRGQITNIESISPRRWTMIVEDNEHPKSQSFNRKLIEEIRSKGHNVTLHSVGTDTDHTSETIARIWEENVTESVVYVSAATVPGFQGRLLLDMERRRCLTALDLIRAFEATRQQILPELTFVTRGAFSNALGEGPLDPGQAPLWGLGRVIRNEHPSFDCHLIDLHSDTSSTDDTASWLAAELLRRDDETEVQLAAGYRFVNRERLMTLTDEARNSAFDPKKNVSAYMLDFIPQGGLDSLYLKSMNRTVPGRGQVEIAVRAAGLNFRDVLWSMGMLPEEAVEEGFSGPTIGMECSGEVVRVGSGVSEFKAGDRVVAFASSCFASHVTTDVGSISLIPDEIDFSEAATIPTAFLTAYYALDYLANLTLGECVLIHGAAGGVGLAAIQIAKLKGAKIIGTAGSDRKRRMLTMLGVDHVLNSRSLDFADDVMRLTGGVGVDVVLNSLAGEAITKSLKCLKPFGRFLEIGKRDLYANTQLGLRPFRRNLSYFAIDADTLLMERRELARSIFKTVMEHFEAGALRPLPFESIPISRALEAFRAMQQSRHIGKLVISNEADIPVSLPVVRTQPIVKPEKTYLVTGGLGGFGLATAKWLVEQGATSLALIGRRGTATEEAITGIAELEAIGATVKAFAADIADPGSLTNVLAVIRAKMAPIGGVIHSAAVIEDAPIMQIGSGLLNRVFAAKIPGAWHLHEATLQDPIDMFVLYSSSSTVVGNPGQGAYVAGNMYLDSLAEYRRSLGLPGFAIGWGAIKDAGFLTRHSHVADMLRTRTGLDATPARDALKELGRLSSVGSTRVCVARFDLQRLGRILPGTLVPRFLPVLTPAAASTLQAEETMAERLSRIPPSERREVVLACIREHAAKTLGAGTGQIDVEQPLADLGLDSLMAVELAVAIERDLAQPISVMQLLSAGNIRAIAELATKVLGFEKKEEPVSSSPEKESELSAR